MQLEIIIVDCKQRSYAIRPRQESIHSTCCNKFFHRMCTSITQTAYTPIKASSPKVKFCCRECTAAQVAEIARPSGEVTRSELPGGTVRVFAVRDVRFPRRYATLYRQFDKSCHRPLVHTFFPYRYNQ